jgi:hypothetical protein
VPRQPRVRNSSPPSATLIRANTATSALATDPRYAVPAALGMGRTQRYLVARHDPERKTSHVSPRVLEIPNRGGCLLGWGDLHMSDGHQLAS